MKQAIGCLLFLLGSATAFAAGGSASSGGGDNLAPDTGAAWFFQADRKIRVCNDLSISFGVSKKDAESAIRDAFSIWHDYFVFKKLDHMWPHHNVEATYLAQCDGSEDLKIKLGTALSPQEARAKRRYDDPSAFAVRTWYDAQRGWGKGSVWVAPSSGVRAKLRNWALPYSLTGILVHELGHVFGCGHVEGTIMSQDIAVLLNRDNFLNDQEARSVRTSIDGERELLNSIDLLSMYEGSTSLYDPSEAAKTFQIFVGRDAVGAIRAKVQTTGDTPEGQSHQSRMRLTLSDDRGDMDFDIHFRLPASIGNVIYQSPSVEILKTYLAANSAPGSWHPEGSLSHGEISSMDGRRFAVDVAYNMDFAKGGGPVRITYFSKDGTDAYGVLFESCRGGVCSMVYPTLKR